MLKILFNPFVMAIIGIGIMFLLDKVGFFEWRLKRMKRRAQRIEKRHKHRVLKKRNGIYALAILLFLGGLLFTGIAYITDGRLFIPIACMVIGIILFVT